VGGNDVVVPHNGVNYSATNTDHVTTHLSAIDTALASVGGGVSEQIKQVSSNYTVTTTDIEDGVRILYTGTADVWYVTLPDPSSLLSSASTVGGAAVDAVSVQVGRDRTGDTNFATTQGVGLLNDGASGGVSGNRTTRGGEWVRAVGFYNGATNNPDWLVEDTNDKYHWLYQAQTIGAFLLPTYYYACTGTLTMTARSSYFAQGQRVLVKNVGTGTVTINAYSGNTVNGQASMTLSAGDYVELMGNPSTSNFEILNRQYDASNLVAPHTGVNYTAANTDSITTHLAGIDTALASAGGGGGGFTYSAISTATTAQAQYHYSVTGATTLTLSASSGVTAGQEVRVKNMGSNTVTIARTGSDTIDGQTSIAMAVQYQALTFVSNGSNGWEII
jgi:hypothetical protein